MEHLSPEVVHPAANGLFRDKLESSNAYQVAEAVVLHNQKMRP